MSKEQSARLFLDLFIFASKVSEQTVAIIMLDDRAKEHVTAGVCSAEELAGTLNVS